MTKEEQSILLNQILWNMLELLGEISPDQKDVFDEPSEITERFFSKFKELQDQLDQRDLEDYESNNLQEFDFYEK